MNTAIITALSCFFLATFASNAYDSVQKDTYIFKKEYTDAQQRVRHLKKRVMCAKGSLLETKEGKVFAHALADCKKKGNCHECPVFIEANAQLRNTEAYTQNFLPIHQRYAYWYMKTKGLKGITECLKKNSDHECNNKNLRDAVHHELYDDFKPSLDILMVREKVVDELYDFIDKNHNYSALNKDVLKHLETVENDIPEYQ